MFILYIMLFYSGDPGFATDCLCGVWRRGIRTCLRYVGTHRYKYSEQELSTVFVTLIYIYIYTRFSIIFSFKKTFSMFSALSSLCYHTRYMYFFSSARLHDNPYTHPSVWCRNYYDIQIFIFKIWMIDSLSYLTPLMFYQIDVMWISGTVPTCPWCPRTPYGNKVFKPANTVFGTNGEWGEWKMSKFAASYFKLRPSSSMNGSVHLSVRPSVCLSLHHTFCTMFPPSCHHEIFISYYQCQKWCPCKRSGSEVKGQGHRGQYPIEPFRDHNSSLNSHIIWL